VHPERLLLVYAVKADAAGAIQPFSFPRSTFLSEKSHAFSGFAAFTNENFNLTGQGDPEQLSAARVSWNFFDVLGVRPAMGRAFLAEEDQAGAKAVCLISHALWTRTFGARADIAGQNITLDAASGNPGSQTAPAGAIAQAPHASAGDVRAIAETQSAAHADSAAPRFCSRGTAGAPWRLHALLIDLGLTQEQLHTLCKIV
jgi:hypothetical protein